MAKTAGVYRFNNLPPASQAANRNTWNLSSLNPSDQAEAAGRDVCAIVDGTEVTVMSPTGNLAAALRAVAAERITKGI
tara:strand:- start:375 stop:608 length:234 start_codon:yes stop_codon:yes gene_type:complete